MQRGEAIVREELDRVTFLGNTGHGVSLHDCSDTARGGSK
jgi:hypothetical protein